MAPDHTHRRRPSRDSLGDTSFTCGVVALVFVFVPIVGDFVAVPAALAAILLALVGIVREDRGVATSSGKALTGGLLGAIATFITFVTFAAMGTFE